MNSQNLSLKSPSPEPSPHQIKPVHDLTYFEEFNQCQAPCFQQFQRFIPTPFLQWIAQYEGTETLQSLKQGQCAEKEVTILFSDIRFFTNLSESLSAHETLQFLNEYFQLMEPCISSNEGVIDKFIGDAILAVFLKPQSALNAALEMESKLHEWNAQRVHKDLAPINFGVGLHTGNVTIGLLGSEGRLESTVIGDNVNLASRLEGLTKEYSCRILLSESTYLQLQERHQIRLIDRVIVRGKSTPVNIYESYKSNPTKVKYQKEAALPLLKLGMHAYFQGNFVTALECFKKSVQLYPKDTIARIYMHRCYYLIEHPPAKDWNGVFQNRSQRYDLQDLPAKLFFGQYQINTHVSVVMKNYSDTGLLIRVGQDHELFTGECVEIEIFSKKLAQAFDETGSLKIPCCVRRRTPGPLLDQSPTMEFGLEFLPVAGQENDDLTQKLQTLRYAN